MKVNDIPERERAKEAAKKRKPPKAVRKAIDKVKRHVEREKPRPETERITSVPDTDPTH